MTAPLGRRLCEVTENRASGGYRVFSLRDGRAASRGGAVLHARRRVATGSSAAAGPSCPGPSPSPTPSRRPAECRLDFLLEGVGPGTERLCALEVGEGVWVNGPLGNAFSEPRELAPGAAGAILVGGGIGVAPLALLRRRFAARGVPTQILLGFRDRAHSGGLDDLFSNCQIGLASDDGHLGERGYVTDLLAAMLEGDDAAQRRRLRLRAAGDARGGAGDVRGARRRLRAGARVADGLRLRRLLRLRRAARRGRLHAPLRRRPGRRRRADRRGDPCLTSAGFELEHPVINASGTFDAIAARRVYGDALLEAFPFAAFVSKTITPEPRAGNDPQRIWETPAGMINSIGLPNKGLDGFLAEDLPQLAELPVPLIVSVMATSGEEFARLVEGVGERDEVAAIELNVSCPNVHSGLIVGEQPPRPPRCWRPCARAPTSR